MRSTLLVLLVALASASLAGSSLCVEPEPEPYVPTKDPTMYVDRALSSKINALFFTNVFHAHKNESLHCGQIDVEYGYQKFVAFMFALQRIRKNPRYHRIELGGLVSETCHAPSRVTADLYRLIRHDRLCSLPSKSSQELLVNMRNPFVAAMTAGSDNSAASQAMLAPIQTLTITPSGSAPSLSRIPFFLRTFLSYEVQSLLIVQLLEKLHWKQFHVIFGDHEYGREATRLLLQKAKHAKLCLGEKVLFTSKTSKYEVRDIISRLDRKYPGRAVVLFISDPQTRMILEVIKELHLEGRFTLIGSIWWGNELKVVEGLEEQAAGSITIQLWNDESQEFMKFMLSMTPDHHDPVPQDWFHRYWQRLHKCRLEHSSHTLYEFKKPCHPKLRISRDQVNQISYAMHTIIATHMLAEGLLKVEKCKYADCLVSCINGLDNPNLAVYKAVKDASWRVMEGDIRYPPTFMFDKNGEGNLGYEILNYVRSSKDYHKYEYVPVGRWLKGELKLEPKHLRSYDKKLREVPTAHLTSPCKHPEPEPEHEKVPERKSHDEDHMKRERDERDRKQAEDEDQMRWKMEKSRRERREREEKEKKAEKEAMEKERDMENRKRLEEVERRQNERRMEERRMARAEEEKRRKFDEEKRRKERKETEEKKKWEEEEKKKHEENGRRERERHEGEERKRREEAARHEEEMRRKEEEKRQREIERQRWEEEERHSKKQEEDKKEEHGQWNWLEKPRQEKNHWQKVREWKYASKRKYTVQN